MNYESIGVADVTLRVGHELYDLGLHRFFPIVNDPFKATLNVGSGLSLDGSPIRPEFYDRQMTIWEQGEFGVNIFEVIRHIGYLAGHVSKQYRFLHAAGIKLGGKGVLLVGKSGNGKSTLASILEGEILDDDLVMACSTDMRRISKFGARINSKRRTIDWIEDDNIQCPINYVFLLNNQYDPDHVAQVQADKVDPILTFDDKLHFSLMEEYAKRMPIPFQVPVLEIGTKREPNETKKAIERIVCQ